MSYIVYMHENKTNHKKYIGITYQKPQKRWKNGYGYKNNLHFFSAIQKYGWDMFEHRILFTDLSQKEAEKKEIELIKKYKSNNREYGYNIDNGGNHLGHFSEEHNNKISKSKKGKPLSEHHKSKLKEAWVNRPPFTEETKLKMSKCKMKKVICVETGEIFNSIKEAEEICKINKKTISNVCRNYRNHKTAGGFHWEYYKKGENKNE